MNDTDAAGYLRELAAMSRQMRSRVEDPSVTLEAAATLLDSRADNEVTEPRALVLRTCAVCGASVPGEFVPPVG